MKLHILAVAVHPDDIELGCSGTLVKHMRKGQHTGILDLTQGELGTRGTPELRLEEAQAAAQIMGVRIRENLGFRDGFFANDEYHQMQLIPYIRKYQPDIVIANALADRHPDHGRAARLISDACFLAGLRRIPTIDDAGNLQPAWRPKRIYHLIQDRQLEPQFVVDISNEFDVKMQSILAYGSQFHNPDSDEPVTYIATQGFLEQVRCRDMMMGKRIGAQYGEGYICENTPGIADLDALLLPEIA